eukprot:gene2562-biopygen9573
MRNGKNTAKSASAENISRCSAAEARPLRARVERACGAGASRYSGSICGGNGEGIAPGQAFLSRFAKHAILRYHVCNPRRGLDFPVKLGVGGGWRGVSGQVGGGSAPAAPALTEYRDNRAQGHTLSRYSEPPEPDLRPYLCPYHRRTTAAPRRRTTRARTTARRGGAPRPRRRHTQARQHGGGGLGCTDNGEQRTMSSANDSVPGRSFARTIPDDPA